MSQHFVGGCVGLRDEGDVPHRCLGVAGAPSGSFKFSLHRDLMVFEV